MSGTLDGIDLVNPDNYVEGVPFEWFDLLRHEAPVSWHQEPAPNHGFWAITRHDDLTQVHMDWASFSSEKGAVALEELDSEQLEVRKTMLETDPPRHTQLRKICSKKFSGRGVAVYEDFIRDVARRVLDQALAHEELDFVSEISRELPIRFLCTIFTVPQDDAPKLISWGDQMIANQDPDLSRLVVDKDDTEEYRNLQFRSPAALEVFEYARRQRDDRLEQPTDDVISALTLAEREGVLTERELLNYFAVLMIAGNETTRHTITSGMLALMQNPDQLQLLKDDPSLIGDRDRGAAALGVARHALPAHGDPRHRAPRSADQGGRQGGHLVHQREPRRGDLPGSVSLRRDAQAQRPRDVRTRRTALLSGRPPGTAGDEDPVPGDDPAFELHRARRADRTDPVELRERHQADAGTRHADLVRNRLGLVASLHRPRGPLYLERFLRESVNPILDQRARPEAAQDRPRLPGTLQARCDVHREPDRLVRTHDFAPEHADRAMPRVHAHADIQVGRDPSAAELGGKRTPDPPSRSPPD